MEGKYGYLTIDPATGDYVYTLYNDNKDVQALGEGDSLQEDFYLMWNGQLVMNPGGGDPCNITVTIKGTNDAPGHPGVGHQPVCPGNGGQQW